MAQLTIVHWALESVGAALPTVQDLVTLEMNRDQAVQDREADPPIILCLQDLVPATLLEQIRDMALEAALVQAQALPTIPLHPTMVLVRPGEIMIPIPLDREEAM